MKTAIVFYGFFRTFDYVKDSFATNIMNTFDDCDIFFSTPKTMFTEPKDEVPEYHHIHAQNNNLVGSNVIDFFGNKLKKFELRDYDAQMYKDLIAKHNVPYKSFCDQYTWRILSMLHSEHYALDLFKKYVEEHNVVYDIVIFARGDVKYHTRLDIAAVHMDKVNYPTHAIVNGNVSPPLPDFANPSPSLERVFADQMLIGSQKNILTFHSLYDNVINYHNDGIHFNHETMMGIHLRRNNVDWAGTNFVLYELWRHSKY